MSDAVLLEAARAERDRRAETFPERIREGADPEALSIEYQCWVAIAEWLETDRFFGFHGGAEPEKATAPWISWPELEGAAKAALDKRELQLARQGWFDGCAPTPTSERRNALAVIHRKVQLMRGSVEAINAAFRAQRGEREIAA